MLALSLPELLSRAPGAIATSDWLTLDADQLGLFARASRLTAVDVDVTISANNRWGSELVDGFLLVSLLVHFQWSVLGLREPGGWGLNYGLEHVRLPAPTFVGDRVRDHIDLLSARERAPGQVLVTTHHELEVEGRRKPALVADWLTLFLTGDLDIVR